MPSTTAPAHDVTRKASASDKTLGQAAKLVASNAVALVESAKVFRINGRTGTYTVTLTATTQSCDCNWSHHRGRRTDSSAEQTICSHIGAALLVEVEAAQNALLAGQN